MRMQTGSVKRGQTFQSAFHEEIDGGESRVESASADEPRQAGDGDVVHCDDDSTRHLNPIQHLRPVEGSLMLTELDGPVRS